MSGTNGNGKDAPTKRGRPRFRRKPRLEQLILARLASGESLVKICRRKRYPNYQTVMEWVFDKGDFGERYTKSRALQAEKMAEDLLEIADDGRNDTYVDEKGRTFVDYDHIKRSILRVDTRKWIAAKLLPKKYGDKGTDINISNTVVTLTQADQVQLQERRKKAEAQLLLQDQTETPK